MLRLSFDLSTRLPRLYPATGIRLAVDSVYAMHNWLFRLHNYILIGEIFVKGEQGEPTILISTLIGWFSEKPLGTSQ